MRLNYAIITRLKGIEWFCNCGEKIDHIDINFPLRYVDSWEEAREQCESQEWESFTLEARNNLTSFLHNKFPREYLEWNKLVKEAKKILEAEILPKILEKNEALNLTDVIIDCVKWDLVNIILEASYSKCGKIPIFYIELLKVYETGNFPCGIDKSNTLVVY